MSNSWNEGDVWSQIEPLLRFVERPSRYIASEWGESFKQSDDVDFHFCMIYPDTYELGQPNQAIRILCNCVNKVDGMFAERSYLPAFDMIEKMKENNIPLFSLETCSSLKKYDAIGITVPHELAYTNILETLDLAQIPILTSERGENCPIILGGGPCTYNPEPLWKFFDAFLIGEGEDSLPEVLKFIREKKCQGASRKDIVKSLAEISGTYVPSEYEVKNDTENATPKAGSAALQVVQKRVYADFATSDAWEPCVVPFQDIVHDRLNVEILRGCARGCRFCQAGMMYRPVRERSADNIVEAVKKGIRETGYEEVSLTSLSTTDHSQIKEILTRLNKEVANAGSGIRVSIPSQRVDSFGVEMAELVCGAKRGGLTLAPEAGTQRLRDVINKNVTEEQILSSIEHAVNLGWRRCKLYFMIGLPTETDDDIVGIAELAEKCYSLMLSNIDKSQKGNLSLTISAAVFVPKVNTPFQWCSQITAEEAFRRANLLKSSVKRRAINVSYHEPKTSLIEAVMSRGGRKIADVVENAWKNGAKFDAWSEFFDEEAWEEAAETCGVDMQKEAHKSLNLDEPLPWEHIGCGVDKKFLREEFNRALSGKTTQDCTANDEKCTRCAVCWNLPCKNHIQEKRVFNVGGDH